MNDLQKDFSSESTPVRPAVRWFLRLRSADSVSLTPAELQEWERFATAPDHRRELTEVKEVWQTVQTLGGPEMPTEAELDADDFDASVSVSQWMARRVDQGRMKTTLFARSGKLLMVAASLAAAIIGVIFFLSPREQTRAFATPVAQQQTVKLADGSLVTLGARTEIHTRITAIERVIVLDRGEAWFNVAHERQRPFKVFAGGGVITAIGTEFNVRRDREADQDRVTVTVGAGVVKVEPSRFTKRSPTSPDQRMARQWEPAKLVKGQELIYDGAGARGEVKRADLEAAAAWKQGRLEYIHQPLKIVVARVNRYSEKPIVLADDAVGEFDFSGTVFEGQVDDWLRALQTAFPVSVIETDEHILIRSRTSK